MNISWITLVKLSSGSALMILCEKSYDDVAYDAEKIGYISTVLYAVCLDSFTEAQALSLRSYLSDSNFDLVCTENKHPTFEYTEPNQTILDYFVQHEWISSYGPTHNGKLRAFPKRKIS